MLIRKRLINHGVKLVSGQLAMSLSQKIGIGVMLLGIVALAAQALIAFQVGNYFHLLCLGDPSCSANYLSCTLEAHIPPELWVGLAATLGVVAMGGYAYRVARKTEFLEAPKPAVSAARELGGAEKQVFDLLASAGGTLMQSELAAKTGLSKVKVTRVLDKLEAKGLLERRRAGMSNAVILKA
jgi:hypothetical protein